MNRTINYHIEQNDIPATIEGFLKKKGFSHQVIVNLKRTQNGILLNDKWAYTRDKLSFGDVLVVQIVESENSKNIVPVDLPLDIAYEDEDIIVVNKPADMPIHPSVGNHDNTMANALSYYFNSKGEDFVFRCINRLDRDTTGLSIVAKHALSAAILGTQASNRQIHRTYMAICTGLIEENGCIDAPIARKTGSTIERCVDLENGESAITYYKRIKYDKKKDLSLAQINLLTGRTHQIRVHMKHIGHPLIGDFLYNPDFRYIKRQALHSYSLEFIQPVTNESIKLIADIPADMNIFD